MVHAIFRPEVLVLSRPAVPLASGADSGPFVLGPELVLDRGALRADCSVVGGGWCSAVAPIRKVSAAAETEGLALASVSLARWCVESRPSAADCLDASHWTTGGGVWIPAMRADRGALGDVARTLVGGDLERRKVLVHVPDPPAALARSRSALVWTLFASNALWLAWFSFARWRSRRGAGSVP